MPLAGGEHEAAILVEIDASRELRRDTVGVRFLPSVPHELVQPCSVCNPRGTVMILQEGANLAASEPIASTIANRFDALNSTRHEVAAAKSDPHTAIACRLERLYD